MKKGLLILIIILQAGISNAQDEWNIIHPYPPHGDHNNVFFVSAEKGWVVGSKGLIKFTDDGGETWQLQHSNPAENLFSVHFVSETEGWTVGWSSLYHTSDGGETWEEQSRPPSYCDLTDIYFINPDTGWIVGTYKTILKTVDGGKNWRKIATQVTDDFWYTSLMFADELHGCAVGRKGFMGDGIVMTTSDGGESWTDTEIEDSEYLTSVFFIDSVTIWICGHSGELRKSTDGGQPWTVVDAGYHSFTDIHFLDKNRGLLLSGQKIFFTFDGGENWDSTVHINSTFYQSSLAVVNDSIFYSVGQTASAFKSIDSGSSWEKLSGGSYAQIVQIGFFNSFNGYAISGFLSDATLIHTSDGGVNWSNDSIIENGPFYMLRIKGQSGYLLNNAAQLIKTNNGGAEWTPHAIPDIGFKYNDLQFVTENTGYLCSKESNLFKTVDGGQNWNAITFSEEYNFKFLYFFDEDLGWAVDKSENKILMTKDGGNTWTTTRLILSDMVLEPTSIFFKDEANGFIATSIGDIYKSEDGGNSWTRYYTFQSGENSEILFTTPTEGWYFGGRIVYHTFDGGETWTNEQNLREPIYDMFFINKDNGWIGGRQGLVANYNLTLGFGENQEENNSVLLFPNPVDNQFEISIFNKSESILTLTVYNSVGQVVRQFSSLHGSSPLTVDVSKLSSGIYFLNVTTNSSQYVVKFVKK